MTISLAAQAAELLLVGMERAAHLELLETLDATGRRKTPPEALALKRQRLEALRAAYATLRDLANREAGT